MAQAGLVVALLWGLQQHPVQRVEQLGLRHTQLVLVTCDATERQILNTQTLFYLLKHGWPAKSHLQVDYREKPESFHYQKILHAYKLVIFDGDL